MGDRRKSPRPKRGVATERRDDDVDAYAIDLDARWG